MAALSKASATAVFDLKSATLTVLAVVLKTLDLPELARAMSLRFDESPGFFDHEPACLDLSAVRDLPGVPDFEDLLALLRHHGLNPIALRSGSAEQMSAGLAMGLAEAPDQAAQTARPMLVTLPVVAPPQPALGAAPAPLLAGVPEPALDAQSEPPEPPPEFAESASLALFSETWPALDLPEQAMPKPIAPLPTRIHDKPLRSGQRIYARGSDLVVLGVVSYGAEVIADGSIHVYGPLRGRAIAGACGDRQARIFALSMQPQLVSIAGNWRTLDEGSFPDVAGKMAQVRLDGERLLLEALKG